MNLQTFLNNFDTFNNESFKQNLKLVIENDNLKNAIKICDFIDTNGYEDSYLDFFNIAFNSNCITIFKYLWKNKRAYDNHDILIYEQFLSKKSRIGKFYFDQLNDEKNIYGNFIVFCHKHLLYNISHILSYVKDKDLKKKLCLDGFIICTTSHPNIECAKYILHQNKRFILNYKNLFDFIINKNIQKKYFKLLFIKS